jgi:hypothetical protein
VVQRAPARGPQTLAGAAYAGGVIGQRYGAHRTTRRGVAYVVALLLVIAGAQVGVAGWWYASAWQERAQFVDAQRLRAALLTFRPSDRAGLAKPATAADLAPERSVRTDPVRCAPLTLLGERPPTDGQSWSGINGSPAQPVRLLTVRFRDAAAARREFAAKQVALLSCGSVRLMFRPFDQPEQRFQVAGRLRLPLPTDDRLRYALVGANQKRYDFYVRRYANTLTWSYGANESRPKIRQEVVDDLIDRLKKMSAE